MTQNKLTIPSEVSFQVGARTMQMLGRENVSSPIVALAEIVKNAYDADADTVIIEFRNASQASGTIRILDDGEGMTFDDIQDKWLVISTDNKRVVKITKKKRRVKVGEKGIGRLGLDRLAEKVQVITKHKEHPTLRLDIDWTKYEDSEESLERIKHSLFEPAELEPHPIGTELLLTGLSERLKTTYEPSA